MIPNSLYNYVHNIYEKWTIQDIIRILTIKNRF